MKKIFKTLIILLVLLPLILVSCSDSSVAIANKSSGATAGGSGTQTGSDSAKKYKTVSVKFEVPNLIQKNDSSKMVYGTINTDEVYAVEDLYWGYIAEHQTDASAPGNTNGDLRPITDGNGVDATVSGFAPGEWRFKLEGYLSDNINTKVYESPWITKNLVFTTLTNVITTPVHKIQDSNIKGRIWLDVENIQFTGILPVEDIKSVDNVHVTYGDIVLTSSTNPTYYAEGVDPGLHNLVLNFTYEGVSYAEVIAVNVYSNFTTVVRGVMDYRELSVYRNEFHDLDQTYNETMWTNYVSFTDDPDFYNHTYTYSETIKAPVKPYFDFVGWTTYSDYAAATSVTHFPARDYEPKTYYAKFNPVKYTITYDLNAKLYDGVTVDTSVRTPTNMINSYDFTSETFLLTSATTRDGYKFNTWTSGTSVDNATSSTNYEVPLNTHGNLNFIASWTPNKYNVKFTTGTGGGGTTIATGTMANEEFTYDAAPKALTSNAFTKDGYTFKHWMRTGSNTTFTNAAQVQNLTTASDGEVELEAVWTSNTYIVAYNGNGTYPTGSTTTVSGSVSSQQKTFDQYSRLASGFTRPGYKFIGYTTNANCTGTLYNTTTDYRNFTTGSGVTVNLYAKWEPLTYTITIDPNPSLGGSAYAGGSNVSTTVRFNDTSVTAFTAPSISNGELLGYYTTVSNTAVKVLSTDSNALLPNVSGITNSSGQWISTNNVTLFAMWKTSETDNMNVLNFVDVNYVIDYNVITTSTNTSSQTSGGVTTDTTSNITVGFLNNGMNGESGTISVNDTSADISFISGASVQWTETTEKYKYTHGGVTSPTTFKEQSVTTYGAASFDGFYTDLTYATKVINANGTFVSGVANFTDSTGKWIYDSPTLTLYAKWVKP